MATAEELKTIFDKFDKNGDGKISVDKLRVSFHELYPSATSEELDNIIKLLDKDGDGYVDFEEFVSCHQQSAASSSGSSPSDHKEEDDDLKAAFDLYDLNGDGKISASELQEVMRRLGERCTVKDCVKMIDKVDVDGDGYVDFQEFKNLLAKR